MRHRAALAVAALAAGALALIAEPGSAATVELLPLADAGCCSISDGSNLEIDPAGDPAAVMDAVNGEFERAADSLGPQAMAIREMGRVGDDIPDGVSTVAAEQPSVLSRVLMIFADLRATVFGNPPPGP